MYHDAALVNLDLSHLILFILIELIHISIPLLKMDFDLISFLVCQSFVRQ